MQVKTAGQLAALAALIAKCTGFTVTDFANAMISGPGLSVVNVLNQVAPAGSAGSFTDDWDISSFSPNRTA
ncbi:hypothetical protein DER44DRAFT_821980 [Fusarium oxysporum]|nr:hypothetical protein DER44DRAFT_821980 [Fusarium oxysporum]